MKYLSYLLCGLLVLAVVSCQFLHSEQEIQQKAIAPFLNGPTKELFKVYHVIFKKEYDLYSEEGVRRYENFKASLRLYKEMKEQNPSLNIDDSMDANPEERMVNENFEETNFPYNQNFSQRVCVANQCHRSDKCCVVGNFTACIPRAKKCPKMTKNIFIDQLE
jgi:hypothetical protein